MGIVLHGIAAGAGIAMGRAHLVVRGMDEVPHHELSEDAIAVEVLRYEKAVKATKRELEQLRSAIPENAPAELGAFISLHLMLLSDVTISREPIDILKAQGINAEWALKQQSEHLVQQFEMIEDDYLRERKQDVLQVVERIYKNLHGKDIGFDTSAELEEDDIILIAHDLSPADTVHFKDTRIAAFVTDVGGATSHTAILGRSLDMPSVIALGMARDLISQDEWVIVDGSDGVLIIDPDEEVLAEYRKLQRSYRQNKRRLNRLKNTAACTKDGTAIELLCNVETPEDIRQLHKLGADGVGLLRSEFYYLNRDTLPDEDELFAVYADMVKKMKGKPLTIRTIDLAADKNPRWFNRPRAANPALGLTGVRLCLAEPALFRTQMRAILRAAANGLVKMMWPMVTSVEEVTQCLAHLEAAKVSLREKALAFDENMSVGAMIETPAAALSVGAILKHVDFISIGTNDLIQYTLAADRCDEMVGYLYQPYHPAVLKLLRHVIRSAQKMNKPVSICGEMAGDEHLTALLLCMGLRTFSMNPNNILAVKDRIVHSDLNRLEDKAMRLLRHDNPEKTFMLLRELNALLESDTS